MDFFSSSKKLPYPKVKRFLECSIAAMADSGARPEDVKLAFREIFNVDFKESKGNLLAWPEINYPVLETQ